MAYFDTIEFKMESCCKCHMVFMMAMSYYRAKKADGSSFYCPVGHAQHYVDTELSILRKQMEREQRDAATLRERAIVAETAQRKAENSIKRLKKRSAAGVCPCCNRTFKELAFHMKSKHAQFRQLQGLEAPKQLSEESA
jgi:hypothetical protein